ncbi:unnamed protein product [Effrenium voratum]|uniref:Uncharacterized protein n=1 Tax=Effrenium voratum TaxID=2562239 RepID=A0AA36HMT1_9DINO|nr:unnamed protein product [Effrenium voratum]
MVKAELSEIRSLKQQLLAQMHPHWETLSASEVQVLFRSPGDVSEVAAAAAQHAHRIKDPQALAALLQASHAIPESPELASAARSAVKAKTQEMQDPARLSVLEAALRKGPSTLEPEHLELREGVRRRLFRAVLDEEPTFDARPSRGFIRFVEKCLAKDRSSKARVQRARDGRKAERCQSP